MTAEKGLGKLNLLMSKAVGRPEMYLDLVNVVRSSTATPLNPVEQQASRNLCEQARGEVASIGELDTNYQADSMVRPTIELKVGDKTNFAARKFLKGSWFYMVNASIDTINLVTLALKGEPYMFVASKLAVSGGVIIQRISEAIEHLEGAEGVVFETIFLMHREYARAQENLDLMRANSDYAVIAERISPTAENVERRVTDHFGGEFSVEQVQRALQSLKEREIIKESSEGRWSITF